MIVRTYKKDAIVNLDHVIQVVLQGKFINALPINNTLAINLGHYATEERAAEVFEWLMRCIDNNANTYMPEE